MVQINEGTVFWAIILIGVLLIARLNTSLRFLIATSALTTIAVFYVNGNSVIVVQLAFLICLIKYIFYISVNGVQSTISKCLYVFAAWCLVTIPFSILHGNTIVHNIDGIDTYVRFSFQQITQYGYLFIGLLICVMCNSLLISKKISIKSIEKCLEVAYVSALGIALLQHILPLEFVNTYLRNTATAFYSTEEARISGTFIEPSMLSLFCAPLFGGYLYRLMSEYKLKYLIFSILFIIVTLDNNASSGVLGIFVSIILILIVILNSSKKISTNSLFLTLLLFVTGTIAVMYYYSNIMLGIDTLVDKISGVGVSGSSRLASFKYHLKLGFNNLIPTGFGTVRSYDLLSTWLCSIGILGLVLYFVPVIALSIKLFKIKTSDARVLFLNIVTHNIIMFISVPEFSFLSIWIYYGMAYYVVKHTQRQGIKNLQQKKFITK